MRMRKVGPIHGASSSCRELAAAVRPEVLAPLLNRRPSSVCSNGRLALALMDALAMLIAARSLDPSSNLWFNTCSGPTTVPAAQR